MERKLNSDETSFFRFLGEIPSIVHRHRTHPTVEKPTRYRPLYRARRTFYFVVVVLGKSVNDSPYAIIVSGSVTRPKRTKVFLKQRINFNRTVHGGSSRVRPRLPIHRSCTVHRFPSFQCVCGSRGLSPSRARKHRASLRLFLGKTWRVQFAKRSSILLPIRCESSIRVFYPSLRVSPT